MRSGAAGLPWREKKKRKKIKRKKGSQYIVMQSKGVTVQKSAVSVVG